MSQKHEKQMKERREKKSFGARSLMTKNSWPSHSFRWKLAEISDPVWVTRSGVKHLKNKKHLRPMMKRAKANRNVAPGFEAFQS